VRELPNINERISYPNLRVVDADGSQLGVITREEALDVAKDRELDLVLVSEKADPPVCRIMDYGKYKFEQEKKAKEAKKKSHQTEVKEVKMRYKIDSHDYQVRIGQAVRFLKDGDKVKCTVIFRGREIQHTALAEVLLFRMAKDLEENAEIQQPPKREGRNMIMFLSPRKASATKGSTEKAAPKAAPEPAA
jgi:translation initiation factor IF-3